MDENKARFCEALGTILCTYSREAVKTIEYQREADGEERAVIVYTNGYRKSVNITGDSCIAVMKDVYDALL